jgi:peroxiredoxin
MNMQQELQNHLKDGLKKRPKEINDIMQKSAQRISSENIGGNALEKGDKIPDATLINATGKSIKFYDYLKKGPLIISFYRGSWCPYCNIELRAYKEILPQIKENGANFIAISPDSPDNSLSLIEKQELAFEVCSDIDNIFAKKIGLVFRVDDDLLGVYHTFGIDLDKAQGNTKKEIPIPATYVIDEKGVVLLAYVNTDYTKRLDPLIAVEALK